jgi:hypothetical protein
MLVISRRKFVAAMPLVGVDYWLPDTGTNWGFGLSHQTATEGIKLFKDVRILVGANGEVSAICSARVDGGAIATIEAGCASAGARVVEGRGRTLIPGLIEAHWQATSCGPSEGISVVLSKWTYLTLRPGGGEVVDLGVVIAPRMWPIDALVGEAPSVEDIGDATKRLRNFSLRIREGVLSICDPLGALLTTNAQVVEQAGSSDKWCSCASVHAFTAKPIKVEIAQATTAQREFALV